MIRVRALGRRFGDVVAIDDVTLDVHAGELFGLVGPDGAGKSTLLRVLAGVLAAGSGDAELGGVSVVADPERVKRDVAYMPQRFGLYADLTVLENLLFYADLYEVPRRERPARLERLFEFSQLGAFKDRLAGKLSGGMKQKLGLSCALIHQPKVLLLDEPTFGVDPVSRRDLWMIVHEMVAGGVTAVVSTSYLDEAERFDRLALLHRGRVLAVDTPDALRRSYPGELAALEVDVDRLREARDLAASHPGVTRAVVFGHRLHVTMASVERDGGGLEATLSARGVHVTRMDRVEPSLEDVFIDGIARAEAR